MTREVPGKGLKFPRHRLERELELFGRTRITASEAVSWFFNLLSLLREAHENRKALAKRARLFLRAVKWSLIKSVGLSLAFLGTVVLLVIPIASWLFVNASFAVTPAELVPFSIGVLIGLSIYGVGGILLFGSGLWMLAPNRRVGRFGRRLILVHLLRRREKRRRGPGNFASRSRFGLWRPLATIGKLKA